MANPLLLAFNRKAREAANREKRDASIGRLYLSMDWAASDTNRDTRASIVGTLLTEQEGVDKSYTENCLLKFAARFMGEDLEEGVLFAEQLSGQAVKAENNYVAIMAAERWRDGINSLRGQEKTEKAENFINSALTGRDTSHFIRTKALELLSPAPQPAPPKP